MKISENELMHTIALSMIRDVGPVNARNLIAHCGGAVEVFRCSRKDLLTIPGMGLRTVDKLRDRNVLREAEKEMDYLARNHISARSYLDDTYPSRLKHCIDSPVVLFVKGDPPLELSRVLAVVGTRRATQYGIGICEKIIAELSQCGCIIVSGLAYGIDACAHRAALAHGLPTAAVLGHGLDRVYPWVHHKLAQQMLAEGGLISDFHSGTKPDRNNFPRRNRIIAGLADAVLVIEAAVSGGALITAGIAQSYDREVMAVPGRVDDEFSAGTNQMIRDNKAALVNGAEDVLAWLGWETNTREATQGLLFSDLPDEQRVLIDTLRASGEASIDHLAYRSGLPLPRVSALLFELELKSLVRTLPGKIYRLR